MNLRIQIAALYGLLSPAITGTVPCLPWPAARRGSCLCSYIRAFHKSLRLAAASQIAQRVWQEKSSSKEAQAQREEDCHANGGTLRIVSCSHPYKLSAGAEDTFRVIKAETELWPNFHRKAERVDAHVFLPVLAFHLIHALRYQLKQRGLTQRWSTIRRILNTQSRVTVRLQKTDGRVVYLRLTLRPTDEQILIYRALGLNPRPLPLRKFLP